MTKNQIDYLNYLESQRHNVAGEAETNRYNIVVGNETNRHNLATEGEAARHNKETEAQGRQSNKETKRHNKATESLTSKTLTETNRHNLATEAETGRSNRANEQNVRYTADQGYAGRIDSAKISANASMVNAQTAAAASKYAADKQSETAKSVAHITGSWNKETQEMKSLFDSKNNYITNMTNKAINEAKNASNESIAALNRMQDAANKKDANAVQREYNEIMRQKNKIDEMYKKGQLSQEMFKNMSNFINQWLTGGTDILKFIM